MSLSVRSSDGMNSKRSALGALISAKRINDPISTTAWDGYYGEDSTHSRDTPDRESSGWIDHRSEPRREDSGTEASHLPPPSPFSDSTDVEDIYDLRTQLNDVILRMARLETGEEAPPDYASSTGQSI
ncbi:hypothetical protein PQX77_008700 [Marasmius sp. AFHP31]|nr:hypothetical protein PQX77_008700 [Marasmius sp. AFHP31]